jgi:hypothetical protein
MKQSPNWSSTNEKKCVRKIAGIQKNWEKCIRNIAGAAGIQQSSYTYPPMSKQKIMHRKHESKQHITCYRACHEDEQ